MPRRSTPNVTASNVLDVATTMLHEHGFASLSVRKLAAALGVSRQVVYTHFGNVDGLLDALHLRAAASLAEDIQAIDTSPGTAAHVHRATEAYMAAARQRPTLFALMFGQPVPSYVPSDNAMAAARASFGHIVAVAASWLQEREIPVEEAWQHEEARMLARVLWSTAHGHVTLEQAGHVSADDNDTLVRAATEAVLRGWQRMP